MISQLSAKYHFGAMHTADTTDGKVTNWTLLSTEFEKVHCLYLPSKAGHRSTLAFLRFYVIAATGMRKHTQVELLWITRRIRRISAFPSNSERMDASVFTSTLPATKRKSRTISTRATDVIFERKHCSRRRRHTQVETRRFTEAGSKQEHRNTQTD